LYARWLQAGIFYPFMRSHTELGTPDKEPWAFGYKFEAINKRSIELRYELLPYIYNVMQQASETGIPALRPLFLDFPDDEHVASMDDEFLFGPDLLVAPVLWEGATERQVYLPAGEWFDYWTGKRYSGHSTIHVPVTLNTIPIFVRGGGFIFRQPVVQNTGEMSGQALRVLIAPASQSESVFYEDDGKSLGYRTGEFMKRTFRQTRDAQTVVVEVGAPEGSYRPAKRELVLEAWMDHEPRRVTATNGETLTHLDPAAMTKSSGGWSYADGVLTIKETDSFKPLRFIAQN
jgi:alpha-glucosidase